MAITWITPAGSLGTIQERDAQEILLNAQSSTDTVTFTLQAGALPRGLRLQDNKIIGSAFEVRNITTSRFVIRAKDSQEEVDRTFSITVEGSDAPRWITPEGLLPVGPNSTFFVLDNDKVDFQLRVLDPDIPAGDEIEYYIPYFGGELPPGLSLSKDGRITGFTDPIFSIEYTIFNGNYDQNFYDSAPYDLGTRPSKGFDSFNFDQITFDFVDALQFPKRLSRYYQFTVVASDGINEVSRSFQIYVVNEDFLRADNTIVQVGTGIFRADNTFVRNPIWITEPDLGRRRANNYVTIYLDVFDPPTLPGVILYRLENINPEFKASVSERGRPGDDTVTFEIIPDMDGNFKSPRLFQKFAITDVYNFADSTLGTFTIVGLEKLESTTLNPSENRYRATIEPSLTDTLRLETELILGTLSIVPPGLELDTTNGELVGRVPYQPRITKTYEFTVTATSFYDAGATASTPRTFKIDILGEIESGVEWLSPQFIGTIEPNKSSQLFIEARSKLRGGITLFSLERGKLPPGLILISTGEIVGKVNQIGVVDKPGMTRFFSCIDQNCVNKNFENTTFDNNQTTFDKVFTFVVKAKDIFNYAETSKTFQIRVINESNIVYSNLYVKAFQKKSKRISWYDFISNESIFIPEKIYRYGDPAFGVQQEIKMLLYAGIESETAEKFVQAISRNHSKKRLKFGEIKKAVAKDPLTQKILYEVVYVDIIDDLMKNNTSVSSLIELPDNSNRPILVSQTNITIDQGDIGNITEGPITESAYKISDRDQQRIFPNSIKNMRDRIKQVGDRDRTYLPLWMRSIQPETFVETGFVRALTLCYARPGQADDIILRIKNSSFDFKTLDFEIDRYLIDSIDRTIQDKYLAFPNRGVNEQ